MPQRFCLDCRKLFDRDSSPGRQRCPACQAAVDRRRNARAPTASRGYGAAHQRRRRDELERFRPGQPCARCGQPIWTKADAQLGHDDRDRSRWTGLEHVRCNEATSTRRR